MQPGITMGKYEIVRFVFFFTLIILCSTGSTFSASPGRKEWEKSGGGLTFVLSDYNGFNISCNGASDGSIDLTPSGTAPFNFTWSTGASSEDLSGLTAGSYTVTVTDNLGVIQTGSVTLTEPNAVAVSLLSVQNVICNGEANGFINVDVSGGVPGYSFLWSNGAITQNVSALAAGTYTVTVTDQNSCTAQLLQTVSQPAVISVSLNFVQDNLCVGSAAGAISINVSGGTPGYTFLWSNGAVTQNISSLPSGTYTVTVTDQNSCTALFSQVVSQPTGINITLNTLQNVLCNGTSTGAVSINVSGGTPGYTFLWSNGAVTQNISALPAGTYTVTVTDQNSCTAQYSQVVSEPAVLSVASGTVQHVLCNGASTGAISINVSGGTPGYSYLWSNGAVTQNLTAIPVGTYTVTVTDQHSCTAQFTQTITEPAAISLSLSSFQNVLCNGASTGAVSITVSGGVPGYFFLWSNGSATQNISSLVAGTYTVTVTDQNSCTAQLSQVVSQPTAISVTLNAFQNVSCNGASNGFININVSGGTPGHSFLWSNGAVTQNLNSIPAGTYTVTVTDQNSCTAQFTQSVSQPPAITITLGALQNVVCHGASTGSISINVAGGIPAYSFLWSNGATTQNLSAITAGTYTVTVSDQNSCTAQYSNTILQPATALSATTSTTSPNCTGSNGSANVQPSGGTPGYTYLWSTGSVNPTINGLAVGTYTVTVTDQNSCSFTTAAQVNSLNGPSISNAVISNVSCNGSANGSIDLTVTGGTAPINYLWSNGQTTQDLSGLNAGTYTVTVTDQSNCTATGTYSVTTPSAINISFTSVAPGCSAPNGSISASVSGGVPGYTYLWSNGETTASISGLAAGPYTITVTDISACSNSKSITLNQTAAPVVSLTLLTPVTCNGGSNGAIDIGISNGTLPYQIVWSNGSVQEDISGLVAGTYTVTVTDLSLCTATSSYTVNQPGPFSITPGVTHASCGLANGTASVSVTGDTPPYSYLWSTGSTIAAISGLSGGNYTVTVTGFTGCSASQIVTVTSGTALLVTIDSVTNINCLSPSSGEIFIAASGATQPYQYLWSDGSVLQNRTGLIAGVYTVTATGNDGCTGTASATVHPASAISIVLSSTAANCGQANGSATVVASGGVLPYTYLWSNGSTLATISNIPAGSYYVTVTAASSCSASDSVLVLNNGAPSINLLSQVLPACDGTPSGSLGVGVSGGLPPYTYLWSNGETTAQINNLGFGVYTVTVSDFNSCSAFTSYSLGTQLQTSLLSQQNNSCAGGSIGSITIDVNGGQPQYAFMWSNGATTQNISGLLSGNYTVTVSDQNGCTVQLTVGITEPLPVTIQGVVTDVSCSGTGGSIVLNVSGGSNPYQYLWSAGQTTRDIFNLPAGTYTVTVTDNSGCTAQSAFTVNSISSLSATFQLIQPVSCYGTADASLAVTAAGGTPGYTFLWSNGSTSQLIASVPAGIYTVTITDNVGCQSLFADTVKEPSPVSFTYLITPPSCGTNNGVLTVQAAGGTFPYTYMWSNGVGASTINGLSAGNYTVTITDLNLCQVDTTFSLINTGSISISSVVDSVSCYNLADGAIDLTISGGAAPYLFTWINTPQNTEDVTGLSAGNYSVIVSDQAGCTSSQSYILNQPNAITISFPLLQNAACGNTNGGVIASANGSFAPFTYHWSTGVQNAGLFNIGAGSYTVTVTDTKNCTATAIASISNNTGPVFTSVDSGMVTCYGGNNGFINIAVSGASPPFTYSWTGSAAVIPSISNLVAGTYTLQVTDALNCISVRAVTVTQPDSLKINPVITQNNPPYNISCYGESDGEIFLSVNGGVPPYNYLWSNGAATQNLDTLVAGPYTVIVTDNAGCSASGSYALTSPPELVANAGQNVAICGIESYVMQATTPPAGFGYWTAISYPGINLFSDSTSANTTVSNLQDGDNIFLWTVQLGSCSKSIQVTITRGTSITASAGTDLSICESTVTLNATNPQFGFGFWRSFTPGVIIDNSSSAITEASNLQVGNNIFLWTIISGNCRDSAEINIQRKDSLDCLSVIRLPTAFSPNSDGYNDVLVVKGLADFPDNTLTVFNRWGVIVYEAEGYDNNWDGVGMDNIPVNDGTYFVILRVRSIDKVFTSYVDLRR